MAKTAAGKPKTFYVDSSLGLSLVVHNELGARWGEFECSVASLTQDINRITAMIRYRDDPQLQESVDFSGGIMELLKDYGVKDINDISDMEQRQEFFEKYCFTLILRERKTSLTKIISAGGDLVIGEDPYKTDTSSLYIKNYKEYYKTNEAGIKAKTIPFPDKALALAEERLSRGPLKEVKRAADKPDMDVVEPIKFEA
ncbi:MAG: hypothetical protein FWE53_03370 [Firmicutes bacterium]|nr:hypothetical protein [Bacillota bacterium]